MDGSGLSSASDIRSRDNSRARDREGR